AISRRDDHGRARLETKSGWHDAVDLIEPCISGRASGERDCAGLSTNGYGRLLVGIVEPIATSGRPQASGEELDGVARMERVAWCHDAVVRRVKRRRRPTTGRILREDCGHRCFHEHIYGVSAAVVPNRQLNQAG